MGLQASQAKVWVRTGTALNQQDRSSTCTVPTSEDPGLRQICPSREMGFTDVAD